MFFIFTSAGVVSVLFITTLSHLVAFVANFGIQITYPNTKFYLLYPRSSNVVFNPPISGQNIRRKYAKIRPIRNLTHKIFKTSRSSN